MGRLSTESDAPADLTIAAARSADSSSFNVCCSLQGAMSSSYQWRGHARMAVREPLSTPTPNISPHMAAKEAQWPSLSSSTRAAASPQSPAPAAPQPVTPVGCQSVAVVIASQVLPPQALWERHRTAMAEDIMHEQGCSQVASYCTLSRYHAACASCARCVCLSHPYENLHACIEVCLCISLGWSAVLFFIQYRLCASVMSCLHARNCLTHFM